MLTIHVWPKRLKEFLLAHPLYKSPNQYLPRYGKPAPYLRKNGLYRFDRFDEEAGLITLALRGTNT